MYTIFEVSLVTGLTRETLLKRIYSGSLAAVKRSTGERFRFMIEAAEVVRVFGGDVLAMLESGELHRVTGNFKNKRGKKSDKKADTRRNR